MLKGVWTDIISGKHRLETHVDFMSGIPAGRGICITYKASAF